MSIWKGTVNTDVTTIKAKTDNLPTDPADQSTVESAITTAHTATDADIAIIDGYHDLPTKNSAANVTIRDALGQKTDDESGNSVYSKLYIIEKHLHSKSCVYPRLAGSIQLQKATGVWAALPTPTEIIPASTVGGPFDLHWCNINTISANGDYVIAFYKGAAMSEIEIACIPVSRSAVQSQEGSVQIITGLLPADTRISAALSSSNNTQNTLKIKIIYHIY